MSEHTHGPVFDAAVTELNRQAEDDLWVGNWSRNDTRVLIDGDVDLSALVAVISEATIAEASNFADRLSEPRIASWLRTYAEILGDA
jgi:hypothetical protein